jgi:dTDP-4-amino-4,6-dideoxygalactose transaminase
LTKPNRIYLSVPHLGALERKYIDEAFESNWLSTVGPNIDAFEESMAAYLGAGVHTLAVSSGTAALHLILRYLRIQSGDHVAVSTLTFAGSVFPILYQAAQPVFIDSETVSGNLDPALLAEYFRSASAAGKLPRALILVHLYGQHADVDEVSRLCAEYGVILIEDAAESLGGTYRGRETATSAPFAILSFNGNKIITTTGGGMVVTREREAIDQMKKWANQAREPGLEYVHREIGYNYRMSNVLAGIGRGQLSVLKERVAARRRVAQRYAQAFSELEGVTLQPEAAWGRHSRWLSVFYLDVETARVDPIDVIEALSHDNIEARPVWRPMHTQPLFERSAAVGGAVAEKLFREGICLPSSSSMSDEDQDRVIASVRRCFKKT